MYLSTQDCPVCGHRLHVTWTWPPVIAGTPTPLVFACQNCALHQRAEGIVERKPFPNDVIITPEGRNVLARHHSAHNQAIPYMAERKVPINDY